MKTKRLSEILDRVEQWPPHVQDELADIALDIESGLTGGDYTLTPAERAGVERGLKDAREGRFVSAEQLERTLEKLRKA